MGYVYNQAQLEFLHYAIDNACNSLKTTIQGIEAAASSLSEDSGMKGEGAAKLLGYICDIHLGVICTTLADLIELAAAGCADYRAKYEVIEGKVNAIVDTDYLDQLHTSLKQKCDNITLISETMKTTLSSSSEGGNVMSYNGLGSNTSSVFSDTLKRLTDLKSSIESLESTEQGNTDSVLSQINAFESLVLKHKNERIGVNTYNPAQYFTSQEFTNFYKCTQDVGTYIKSVVDNHEQTQKSLKSLSDQRQELLEKAEKIKFGLAILETVVTIAVAAPLAAVAGPLGVAAVGAVTGAIRGAVSEGLDQWASGSAAATGGLDFGSIGYEAFKGGVIGGVTSYMGAALGPVKAGASFGKKFMLNYASEFTSGLINQGFDVIDDVRDGSTWSDALSENLSAEKSLELVTNCAVGSFVDTGVGWVSDKFDDKFGLDDLKKSKPTGAKEYTKKYASIFAKDAGEDIVKSVMEDGGKGFIEGFVETDENGHLSFSASGGVENAKSVISEKGVDGYLKSGLLSGGASTIESVYKDSDLYEQHVSKGIQEHKALQDENGAKYTNFETNDGGSFTVTEREEITVSTEQQQRATETTHIAGSDSENRVEYTKTTTYEEQRVNAIEHKSGSITVSKANGSEQITKAGSETRYSESTYSAHRESTYISRDGDEYGISYSRQDGDYQKITYSEVDYVRNANETETKDIKVIKNIKSSVDSMAKSAGNSFSRWLDDIEDPATIPDKPEGGLKSELDELLKKHGIAFNQ